MPRAGLCVSRLSIQRCGSTVIICTIRGSVNALPDDSVQECPFQADITVPECENPVKNGGIRLLSYSAIGIHSKTDLILIDLLFHL